MKILALNNIYNTPYKNTINNQTSGVSFGSIKPLESDKVEINHKTPYQTGIAKLKNITKEEYFSLTNAEKVALREKVKQAPEIFNYINMHQYAAEAIEVVFNKQYGKGNYVVIPVGRSLSSIAKLLELRIGKENVKNIPLSAAGEFYTSCKSYDDYKEVIKSFTELDGFDKYKEYLKSIGLDKDTINNSGKNYIIMDYTASGFSLNGAYTVLTSNELLGNQKRNITTASMKDIVSHTDDYLYLLDNYLEKCRFKRFSYIDSLYENLGDVYRASDYTQFEDITKQEYLKLFGFELLDREYSGGKIPFRNKLKPLAQRTAPIQNGKIWNEKQKQFNVDLREDAQEVLKIMHSLRKPLDEIDDINNKLAHQNLDLAAETEKYYEEIFMEKFPLEYEYHKNIEEFEKIKPHLHKYDCGVFEPIIKKGIYDFDTKTEIHKALNLIKSELEKIKEKPVNINGDFIHVSKNQKILEDLLSGMKEGYFSKIFTEDYYVEFRPKLLKTIQQLSQRFNTENVESLTEDIVRTGEEKFELQNSIYKNFLEKIKLTLASISQNFDQVELKEIIKSQKETLQYAKKCLLRF